MAYTDELLEWQKGEGAQMFQDVGLSGEAHVIDFGCGPGHYTFALAYALEGAGKVYAVDTDHWRLKAIVQQAKNEGLTNIEAVHVSGDCRLDFMDDNSADGVLIYDLIHQLGRSRSTFLNEAYRVLKPGGVLSIAPFHMGPIDQQELSREAQSTGFESPEILSNACLHFEMHEWLKGERGHLREVERGDNYLFRK